LDVLAGRKTVGQTTGTILFDGRRPTKAFLRRHTGYVEQFDTLVTNMTIQEMLWYTCEMVSSISESKSSKRARVAKVIDQLALGSCKDVLVGNSTRRGASGGQLKRANIALALVGNPKVLFLDEPTSGLDSFTAAEVMDVVRNIVNDSTGICLCATIHSPSQHVFGLFDRAMVLLNGRVVHFASRRTGGRWGPQSSKSSGLAPLASIAGAGIPPYETNLSEAEWLTDLVVTADREGRSLELAERYARSSLAQANAHEIALLAVPSVDHQHSLQLTQVRRSTETPALFGYWKLLKHRMRTDYRDLTFIAPRFAPTLLINFIILTLYLGIGDDLSMANVPNVVAAFFMFTILPGFIATSYIPAIVLDRPLFLRERADGLYTPLTYFAFKMTEELTLAFLSSPVFASMVFYGVQLQGSFVVVWLAYLFTTACGISLGYSVAALSKNMDIANTALPAFVSSMLFWTGNLIRYVDMPVWLRWVLWIDFLHYPFAALTVNQFQGTDTLMVGGIEVLEYFSLTQGPWFYLGIQIIFFVAFSFIAWAGLAFVRHERR